MPRKYVWAALAVLLTVGCVSTAPDDAYSVTTLALPTGHAETGRQTFAQMGCANCHAVAWDTGFAEPASPNRGPTLDATLTRRSVGNLATSIVAPSYHVRAEYRELTEAGLSPMADYSDTLSVRDVADLVRYLRTQGTDVEPTVRFDRDRMPHHI